MDINKINEEYKKFNIPMSQVPNYSNAEEFAQNFKKCSVLKEINVCYSSETGTINGCQNIQE